MAGMTDYSAQNWLNYITGKAAIPALGSGSVYVALFTTAPTSDAGVTGAVEVSGTSYARQQTLAATWNSAVASAGSEPSVTPASITNAAAITFNPAGSNWGTVVAFGLFDALTVGNLLAWDYIGNYQWVPFSASLASPSVLTAPGHGYANGDPVVLSAKYGGTLPATAGSWAGIKTVAGVAGDTFNVGVNATGTGEGLVRKILQQAVPIGVQPIFGIGSLAITAA